MRVAYDKYYQCPNLFGDPSPELLAYFEGHVERGKILDLGCGQGRDALALARLGFQVTGVDHSEVGIRQLMTISDNEQLGIVGLVSDIYNYTSLSGYDFVLLDSMFHFNKRDRKKEVDLLKRILNGVDTHCSVVLCIPNNGQKVDIAKSVLGKSPAFELKKEIEYVYTFLDQTTGHSSETAYCMLVYRHQDVA